MREGTRAREGRRSRVARAGSGKVMMSMTRCGRATAVRARGGARGTRARGRGGARAASRRDVGIARAIQEDRGLSAMEGDSNGDGDAFEGRVREALMKVRAARDAVAILVSPSCVEGML